MADSERVYMHAWIASRQLPGEETRRNQYSVSREAHPLLVGDGKDTHTHSSRISLEFHMLQHQPKYGTVCICPGWDLI